MVVLSYRNYQENIPNGDLVPDPTLNNGAWKGVGHLNANGGGTRNVFGEDFAANGHVGALLTLMFSFHVILY